MSELRQLLLSRDPSTSPTPPQQPNTQREEEDAMVATVPTLSLDRFAVPVLADASTTTSPLAENLGRLQRIHDDADDLDAGYAAYYQPRRKLSINNDDYEGLNAENKNYVRRVYAAITTNPSQMDDSQTKVAKALVNKLKPFGNDADKHLADISSMLVAAVFRLHNEGDYLYALEFSSLKPRAEDNTMTATQRVEAICNIVHTSKKHVMDLLEGADAIAKFVAAPLGAVDRKARYKENNDSRAQRARELRDSRILE